MSTTLQGFRLTARSCVCREVAYRFTSIPIDRRRALSTTAPRWRFRDHPVADVPKALKQDPRTASNEDSRAAFDDRFLPQSEQEAFDLMRQEIIDETASRFKQQHPPFALPVERKRLKQTFMNMGDPEPWEVEGMLDDDHDDIPVLAHGELEQHREMRHYARLAAWDMPMLSKLAKPFEPPTEDMTLRFRYTTYMGEQHPAEKKVVLEFSPADMPDLNPIQRDKLKKLVGVRYNPEKDIVKMSCEMYETQAQNKRYLGDIVDELLRESRTGDTFEDVPLDLRHHKFKPKPKFPKEWVMTEQRQGELEQYRLNMQLEDQKRELTGQIIDGLQSIAADLAKPPPVKTFSPVSNLATKSRGKRVSVRR